MAAWPRAASARCARAACSRKSASGVRGPSPCRNARCASDCSEPRFGVYFEQLIVRSVGPGQTTEIDPVFGGEIPEQRGACVGIAVNAVDHPLEDANVLSVTWPHEAAVSGSAKPIHRENQRWMVEPFAHIEPVRKIIGHVVSTEWAHGHRVAARYTRSAGSRGGGLGDHGRANVDTVCKAERFIDQRCQLLATTAEDDPRDGYPFGVVNSLSYGRAMASPHGVARVGVRDRLGAVRRPPLPIENPSRRRLVHTFPPNGAIGRSPTLVKMAS